MNIIINQKKLSQAVKNAERIISRNSSLPILQTLLLRAEKESLKVSATNLEIGVNYYVGAKINEPGIISVPAKIFSDFISNVQDEKLEISTKGNVMNINSDKYKTQILCFNADDFPIIPQNKNKETLKIKQDILKKSLLNVIDSASLSDTRPELNGVYINFENNKLILAATDSYRLAENITEIVNLVERTLIMPRNTALELIRALDDSQTDISLSFSDNQIFIGNDNFEMISRLIDGKFPDYKNLIPDKFISLARVQKDELEKGIKIASVFSSNIFDIKIKVEDKKAFISAKNSDRGETNATLVCELKNEPFELTANYTYILEGLKSINTESVLIKFTGDGGPLVIKPAASSTIQERIDDKNSFTYLVMPMRS